MADVNDDFQDKVRRAAADGRPAPAGDLGPNLVQRGHRRRRRQRVGQGVAAALLITVAAVGVANLDANTGSPVITSSEAGPSVSPSASDASPVTSATPTVPEEVATLLPVDPRPTTSPDPSSEPTGQPSPSATPSSRPPASSGGASDVGVTADTVAIHLVEQASGAAPLPLSETRPISQAVKAYALYVERERGPIHGRNLVVEVSDGRGDPGSTRQSYRVACDEAFAVVGGSMGPDEGDAAAQAAGDCGLPDLRSTTFSEREHRADTVFSVTSYAPLEASTAAWAVWADQEPEAVGAAAWVRSDHPVQGRRAGTEQAATSRVGYEWVVDHAYPIGDTSWYGLVVDEMEREGVDFVHFDGGPVDAIRFAQKMEERGFEPALFTLAPHLHLDALVTQAPSAFEGAQVAIDVVPAFEHRENAALGRYVKWLREFDPNAQPTTAGARAWAAMDLFVDSLEAIGPEPTREALLEHLDGVRGWTAGGMVGARPTVFGGVASDCFVLLGVRDGTWTRADRAAPGRLTC